MKVNSVNNINYRGKLADKAVNVITKHPEALLALAGSSVIGQKIVMSGAEATIGPAMDIGIGKVITNITDEKDGRTNQSSKVQANRTAAQAIGGAIIGVIIRGACIASATALCMKLGKKGSESISNNSKKLIDKLANTVNVKDGKPIDSKNLYQVAENAKAWGKNLGGAIAIGVMLVTNFIIDVPFINWLNNKFATKNDEAKKEIKLPAPNTEKTEGAN